MKNVGDVTGVDATAAAAVPAAVPAAMPAAVPAAMSAGVPAAISAADTVAVADAHEGTRHRVARSILENGPSTAAALADRLDLTPAAVRRHLDTLVAEGLIEPREQRRYGPQRRGRGRPAKVFVLTDAGRDAFYQAYDELAVSALRFLADEAGSAAVERFARSRVAEMEKRYRPLLESELPEDRPQALAEALSGDGYAATARTVLVEGRVAGGQQLCQHHCPVAHVAEQFPQLCEAETEVFGRLLETHVQRLATIAHGDGICTTYIPSPMHDTEHDRTNETENTPESRRNPA